MRTILIYQNKLLFRADERKLLSFTPGVLKAKGVFETAQFLDGRIIFFDDHWRRFQRGLRALRLKNPFSAPELMRMVKTLIARNRLKDARVRVMVWKNGDRQQSAVICQRSKLPFVTGRSAGFRVIFAKEKKNRTKYSHLKTLDYQNCYKAFLAAKRSGAEEAILFNHRGFVAEGARSNIFFVKSKTLVTPALSCGCLDGIVRRKVLQLAKKLKVPVRQASVKGKIFYQADEIFLTNSLIGIVPLILAKKDKDVSKFPGPLTERLKRAYQDLVASSSAASFYRLFPYQ